MKYKQFIFEDFSFNADQKTLRLDYSFDGQIRFTETYRFDFDFAAYNQDILNRACQSLFLMAGVSYYKIYLAPKIVIKKAVVDQQSADFLAKTYQKGLGEFFFTNKLDPQTPVIFPVNAERLEPLPDETNRKLGMLIGIGGGKDSLVSVELLRQTNADIATWSVGHRPQLTPLVERIGLPHYWVERQWDPSILDYNAKDGLNGHIPISAILACAGVIVAILAGKGDVVVSNENSANEPTLHYKGVAINHQYSKSSEFEQDFQSYLNHILGNRVRYYSLLRPFSELYIAELFAQNGFDKYHDVFSSCNQAFRRDSDHLFWDGTCPKCAFVFLALAPFVQQDKLEKLFDNKNLLRDIELEPTYRQLLGIAGDKPLECVGEILESRSAMELASQIYPEIKSKYTFETPTNYDYRTLARQQMPPEIFEKIMSSMASWRRPTSQP